MDYYRDDVEYKRDKTDKKSNRFGTFLKSRIDNNMLDLKDMDISLLQENIKDYLMLELYQYRDIDDDTDLSIESICALLSSYMYEEDLYTFYLDLIIEVVNTINQTRRWKSIIVQLGQESGFKDLGRHYCFQIDENQLMEENFILLFHAIEEENQFFHTAKR